MGTLCLSGAALFKAGAGVSTALVEADYNYAILQAEGEVCAATRYNWIDDYAGLNADVKYILEGVTSDLAAINLINYDFEGYPSRIVAEDMINVLRDSALRKLSILRDKKTQTFINGT